MVSLDPRIVMICAKATRSSLALKNGYLPLKRERRITPAAHMSMAGDTEHIHHMSHTHMITYSDQKI